MKGGTVRLSKKAVAAVLAVAVMLGCGVPADAAAPRRTANAPYRIMFLGDSITVGVGDPGLNGARNYLVTSPGVTWLNPDLVGVCPKPTEPQWKCVGTPTMADKNHSGSAGWRTDEILARVPWYMDWYDPQAVLLMAGANDIGYPGGYDLPNYGNRIGAIIDTILTKRPGTHVFVATMTQFRDQRPIVNQLNQQVVAAVQARNQTFVHLVPQHIVGDEPDVELADHVHPNQCGYARMAYVWYVYMEPVFSPALNWPAIPNPFYGAAPC